MLPCPRIKDDRIEVRRGAPEPKSEAWLASKVKAALLFHRSVSAKDTEVDVKDGVVTLRGTAETQAQKELAGRYARDVEGVKSVDNRIVVLKEPGERRRIEDRIDDSSITAQSKVALLLNGGTSGLDMHIETRDGVVTLTGSAKSRAERDLAEKIVADIAGVKSVENRIKVGKD